MPLAAMFLTDQFFEGNPVIVSDKSFRILTNSSEEKIV